MDTPALLKFLELADAKLQLEVGPNVFAFGAKRALGRIRAYSSAGLQPFAGRGMPTEFHLLGHAHFSPEGKLLRIEGFNGQEGERWARNAEAKLKAEGILPEDCVVQPAAPLRGCAFTGVR